MTRITKTAWFGPKRFGWGWTPVSWQGWVVTIAFSLVGQLVSRARPRRALVVSLALAAAFVAIAALTGDPPRSRRHAPEADAPADGVAVPMAS